MNAFAFRTLAWTMGALASSLGCGSAPGSSESGPPPTPSEVELGERHSGQYHEGPVDFAETAWHNACAPAGGYKSELQASAGLFGEYIAGVSGELSQGGSLCDACIRIDTEQGKSIVARLVTYGVHQAPGDIDVSPSVYAAIHDGEYPRAMRWSLTPCPDAGNVLYEFQGAANPYWMSLWVRNARLPITKVEAKRPGERTFTELSRAEDGTLTRPDGVGDGAFTLRITAIDGQVIEDELEGWTAGALVDSGEQFD